VALKRCACLKEFGARFSPPEPEGPHLLMELELIESSMYLRTNEDAPERFAAAFDEHKRNLQGASS
jgi:hypothetical protein